MGAVATRSQDHAPVVQQTAEVTSILQVIQAAAINPAVDIDKMERLFAMHERVVEREARAAYFAALADMQPELPVVGRRGMIRVPAKDGRTGHETPYALWEDVNEAIRPILSGHGFGLSFRVKKDADRVEVTGILSHKGGHFEETMLSLPMDSTGSKNNVQAIGSSVSYGKRYTAFALLNITSRGEDDDGKAAGDPGTINEAQIADLRKLMGDVKADEGRFLKFMHVDKLEDIPAIKFDAARKSLEAKRVRG